MTYAYQGTLRTRPGRRDEVVAILLGGADGLRAAGCHLYAVGVSETDPDLVVVSELWSSKEHHDASLELPETKASIAAAMPMLTGEFTGVEARVEGGLGVDLLTGAAARP
ncbi:putative quinol monooxygenase [Jiangella anatolica]|uniref:Antibiotic biosynthesis monooxygenase n=1 Tax=Jiangella anatolica TaxID=2670374 RepID=A0A2W2AZT5_9ACTN|nr:putative quinol monooxygenase [Jiangella anatolica]PZF80651.1 antibiotic biosynthesis monooxygenase [Jiangella anatolica]